MCKKPKLPKQDPLAIADPNAGRAAAEAEMRARAKSGGFSSTIASTPESRMTGGAASRLLFGA